MLRFEESPRNVKVYRHRLNELKGKHVASLIMAPALVMVPQCSSYKAEELQEIATYMDSF